MEKTIEIIANSSVWMEGNAIEQLKKTAELEGMVAVAGMPDLHPGRGYPVGASFLSHNHFYPALVGNDIGCGMAFYQTDLPKHKWSGTKLVEKLGNIDSPLDKEFNFGTIGGGNHFAEVMIIDTIYAPDFDKSYPFINKKSLTLLVHSGSRGMGDKILREHIEQFNHKGLPSSIPESDTYFQEHNKAMEFAVKNREAIANRMLEQWKAKGNKVLDICHNFVEKVQIDGKEGFLHRKGATPSNQGLVVIPGSRGDYSYLVKPLEGENAKKALYSLAHGAGRKWMRSDCYGKLQKFHFQDLLRNHLGNTIVCNNKDLVYEEAPQAYKGIESVIESLEEFGLIEKILRLKPVMTYKTSGDCLCQ